MSILQALPRERAETGKAEVPVGARSLEHDHVSHTVRVRDRIRTYHSASEPCPQ